MAQSNFNDRFERSLKERKHFHFELVCATTAVFRASNIDPVLETKWHEVAEFAL